MTYIRFAIKRLPGTLLELLELTVSQNQRAFEVPTIIRHCSTSIRHFPLTGKGHFPLKSTLSFDLVGAVGEVKHASGRRKCQKAVKRSTLPLSPASTITTKVLT